jgi:hypothetical protein
MTARGYDEAVAGRSPFQAEPVIRAEESADVIALSEADPMSDDELVLQGAGRDLRPDTITPGAGMTATDAALIEEEEAADEGAPPVEEDTTFAPLTDANEASAPEVQVSSAPAPEYGTEANDEHKDAAEHEKQDASDSAQ